MEGWVKTGENFILGFPHPHNTQKGHLLVLDPKVKGGERAGKRLLIEF